MIIIYLKEWNNKKWLDGFTRGRVQLVGAYVFLGRHRLRTWDPHPCRKSDSDLVACGGVQALMLCWRAKIHPHTLESSYRGTAAEGIPFCLVRHWLYPKSHTSASVLERCRLWCSALAVCICTEVCMSFAITHCPCIPYTDGVCAGFHILSLLFLPSPFEHQSAKKKKKKTRKKEMSWDRDSTEAPQPVRTCCEWAARWCSPQLRTLRFWTQTLTETTASLRRFSDICSVHMMGQSETWHIFNTVSVFFLSRLCVQLSTWRSGVHSVSHSALRPVHVELGGVLLLPQSQPHCLNLTPQSEDASVR